MTNALNSLTSSFQPYLMTYQHISIQVENSESENELMIELSSRINGKHKTYKVNIRPEYPRVWEVLQKHFDLAKDEYRYGNDQFISPKKLKEQRQDNRHIVNYVNGVLEDFTEWCREFHGTRTFPDGTQEIGRFNILPRKMYSGCIIKDGNHQYISSRLFGSKEGARISFAEVKFNGNSIFTPLEHQETGYWIISPLSLHDALYQMACSTSNTIGRVLTHPKNTVECKDFIDFLMKNARIFQVTLSNLKEIVLLAEQRKIHIDWKLINPQDQISILEYVCEHLDIEWIKLLLKECKNDFLVVINKKNIIFNTALQSKPEWMTLFAEAFNETVLSLENRQLFRAYYGKEVDFSSLSHHQLLQVYIAANTCGRKEWVKQLNALGMQVSHKQLAPITKPSILSPIMDLICAEEAILTFLFDLRQKHLLLSPDEYQQLKREKWISKGADLGRVLGRNYIEETAAICGFHSIKTPTKIVVLHKPALASLWTIN